MELNDFRVGRYSWGLPTCCVLWVVCASWSLRTLVGCMLSAALRCTACVHAVVRRTRFSRVILRRYLGGERHRRVVISDISISMQNRASAKIKRDLDPRKIGNIANQNQQFDEDLQF